MIIIALLAWAGFITIVLSVNPFEAGVLGYVLFYAVLFIATMATLSLFGFLLRSRILQGELVFKQVAITFRQAFWFGLLVTLALWLQARDLLTWWSLLLLIVTLSVVEFFFLSLKKT